MCLGVSFVQLIRDTIGFIVFITQSECRHLNLPITFEDKIIQVLTLLYVLPPIFLNINNILLQLIKSSSCNSLNKKKNAWWANPML